MVTVQGVRAILVVVLAIGALGIAGPEQTYSHFEDIHNGSGSFEAADEFPNNGGNNGGGPTADAGGPYEVYDTEPIQLDGSGSTSSQGNIDSYAWQITNGPGELYDSSSVMPTYEPEDVEDDTTVTIELTVSNNDQSDTDYATISVRDAGDGNSPPVARFTSTRSGDSPNVDLDGSSSSDPDGTIESYHWEWTDNDGNTRTATEATLSKQQIPRETDVTLTVTDDEGASDSVTKSV